MRRIVVKVGSSSISGDNVHQIDGLVAALARMRSAGVEVVLVSSGAMATAYPFLGLDRRPDDLATQQAAAAVGQSRLMWRYQNVLDQYDLLGGQVLLTASDLEHEATRVNAGRALERLLELGILPIVNENDTVATEEIRFGDNDRLAALVSELIRADALVLLSDVDAIYTKPPHLDGAERIAVVGSLAAAEAIEIGSAGAAGVGTGGASTKIGAALYAANTGVAALITSTPLLDEALRGADVGTWFPANPPESDA
ncbi:MAG TPA: glutamate 5-kinase [Microbacteriaceae bacterium]|nr:glutamate 5-kinase [Microbacteriaceae bacterium]